MSEFVENNQGVHLLGGASDYTICGLGMEGYHHDDYAKFNRESHEDLDLAEYTQTKKRIVTCPDCKIIIEICRGVRTAEKHND